MPYDPNTGLYAPGEATLNPGLGGPLRGMLDLMNAFQGQKLRGRAVASQQQTEEEQMLKNLASGGEGMYSDEDNPATALGVPPERQGQIIAGTPRGKFATALADWKVANPGKQPSPDEVATMQMESSGTVPAGAYGLFGREATEKGKITREEASTIAKATELARKATSDFWNKGGDNVTVDQARAAGFQAAMPIIAGLSEGARQAFKDQIAAMDPSGLGASAEGKSKRDLRSAQATLASAHAEYLRAIEQPNVKKALAQAGLAQAHASLARSVEALNQIKEKGGGLSPAGQITGEKALAQAEDNIAKLTEKASFATPDEQEAYQSAIVANTAMRDNVRKILGRGGSAAATPPGAQAANWASPGHVLSALKEHKISPDEAHRVLKEQFGYRD